MKNEYHKIKKNIILLTSTINLTSSNNFPMKLANNPPSSAQLKIIINFISSHPLSIGNFGEAAAKKALISIEPPNYSIKSTLAAYFSPAFSLYPRFVVECKNTGKKSAANKAIMNKSYNLIIERRGAMNVTWANRQQPKRRSRTKLSYHYEFLIRGKFTIIFPQKSCRSPSTS